MIGFATKATGFIQLNFVQITLQMKRNVDRLKRSFKSSRRIE